MKQANAIKTALSDPKSSIDIIVHESGVLVAPEKTATKPMPAMRAIGKGKACERALPRVAPT
ncbi:hypothetical protein GCM10028895_09170 [Pontibacter rugosus]